MGNGGRGKFLWVYCIYKTEGMEVPLFLKQIPLFLKQMPLFLSLGDITNAELLLFIKGLKNKQLLLGSKNGVCIDMYGVVTGWRCFWGIMSYWATTLQCSVMRLLFLCESLLLCCIGKLVIALIKFSFLI